VAEDQVKNTYMKGMRMVLETECLGYTYDLKFCSRPS
jgi:hypothetical protein